MIFKADATPFIDAMAKIEARSREFEQKLKQGVLPVGSKNPIQKQQIVREQQGKQD